MVCNNNYEFVLSECIILKPCVVVDKLVEDLLVMYVVVKLNVDFDNYGILAFVKLEVINV